MSSRSLIFRAVTLLLLTGLFLFLFGLPLRPTAWGGPRGAGPFEDGSLPGAGWIARDARLGCETVARWRSPDRHLEATAEALAGYYGLLAVARYAVLWLVLWRLGQSGWLAAVAVVAAAVPLAFGAPRHDETDLGLLLFVLLLAATTPHRPPWWVVLAAIPLLFLLWANAHTSAIVGLAWLTIIVMGRAVEWWRAQPSTSDRPAVGRLLVALVLGAAAVCANPDGPRLFVEAFAVTKNPGLAGLPGWQPVDFSKPSGMPWGYFASIAIVLVVQVFRPGVLSPTAILLLLTFGIWPLLQQRGLSYWWLIVAWIVVALFRNRERSPDSPFTANPPIPGWWNGIVLGVVTAAILTTPAARWLLTGRPRAMEQITSSDTPWQLARELQAPTEAAGTFLPELRTTVRDGYPNGEYRGAILGGLEQGDFLAWVLEGDNNQPVMLYSRPETLEPRHWAEASSVLEGGSDWWETLGRHQVNLVVIDPGKWNKLADRLRRSAEWRTVQDTGPGGLLVAVRREPKLPAEMLP